MEHSGERKEQVGRMKGCPGEGKSLVLERHSGINVIKQKWRSLSLENGWRPELEASWSEELGTWWEEPLPSWLMGSGRCCFTLLQGGT